MTPRIAVLSASLGSLDKGFPRHVQQTMPADYYQYTDTEMPPRTNVMGPRLQAKIPKMMGWDLEPGYDFYIWADATISFAQPDVVEWLVGRCRDTEVVFFRHQDGRSSIQSELRFMLHHMEGTSGNRFAENYLNERYATEPMEAQVGHYLKDNSFPDNRLFSAGLFIYRNLSRCREFLTEWFVHCVRWSVQDQLSLPYVLWKYRMQVQYDIIDEDITHCSRINYRDHSPTPLTALQEIEKVHVAGKWDEVYKALPDAPGAFLYGDTITYELGAKELADCATVEDWGVGAGGFLRYRPDAIGIDGSHSRFASKVVDLTNYHSGVHGIFMRHVLEHNFEWKKILINALKSVHKTLVLVLFTPLVDGPTIELKEETERNRQAGINVPTLSLGNYELRSVLGDHQYTVVTVATPTRYGQETIFVIRK